MATVAGIKSYDACAGAYKFRIYDKHTNYKGNVLKLTILDPFLFLEKWCEIDEFRVQK